jgi:hypothetical protein
MGDRINRNVRYWPKADIPTPSSNIRFWGQSGHFWLQSDIQAPQVANCHFMSALVGKADMLRTLGNARL